MLQTVIYFLRGYVGEQDKLSKAKENKHMTFYEQQSLLSVQVERLWLTHYSPSLNRPERVSAGGEKDFCTPRCKDGRP